MNREVKLRIKLDNRYGFEYFNWNYSEMWAVELCCCNEESLCQYTGLKDKNGKEIYEGDVVTVGYGKGKVEYSNNQAMFIITWIDDKEANNEPLAYEPNQLKFGKTRTDIEVIGNIYETPELIK